MRPTARPHIATHRRGDTREAVAGTSRLRVQHVLLLSIDGMHEVDLARFVADQPRSHLARLARTGVTFTNAWVNELDGTPTNPSDSFPGLLALTTGGSSPTTGGWYDVSYARDLYPDASCKTPGTMVAYDETAPATKCCLALRRSSLMLEGRLSRTGVQTALLGSEALARWA